MWFAVSRHRRHGSEGMPEHPVSGGRCASCGLACWCLLASLNAGAAFDRLAPRSLARCFPPCARSLGLPHVALNRSAGQRVRGTYHIQTVGNRQGRFKAFLSGFRGVATKYLGNYLLWFELDRLDETASPSSCLGAAVNASCIRFTK